MNNNLRTMLYLEDMSYWDVFFNDLIKMESCTTIHRNERFRVKNPAMKLLCRLHHSANLNHRVRLPFKNVWKKWDVVTEVIKRYNISNMVFTDTSIREFDLSELVEYKRLGCTLRIVFFNPVKDDFGTRHAFELASKGVFDRAYSVDLDDAEKYGFVYLYQVYSKQEYSSPKVEYDLLFVGNAKGREDKLKAIAQKVHCAGIRSLFYISGVEKQKTELANNIIYNQHLPYNVNIDYILHSNCILEVLQQGQHGLTIRVCEAVCCNKKLLTNNPEISSLPFYDPRYMRYFEEIDQDVLCFLREEIPVKYEYHGEFSPLRVIEPLD